MRGSIMIQHSPRGGSAKFCCDTNKIFRTKQTRRKQAKIKIIKNSNLKSHYELQFKISGKTEYVHNCFFGLLTCRCLSNEFNTA